ncbi:hypothetical protein [Gordonia desulfuricans]|nr:hypothetical protein [Gordonia desulfuricans]
MSRSGTTVTARHISPGNHRVRSVTTAAVGCVMAASLTMTVTAIADARPSGAPPDAVSTQTGVTYGIARLDAATTLVASTDPTAVRIWPTPDLTVSRVTVAAPAANPDEIRIGNLRLHRPGAVPPQVATQVSEASGVLVQGISDVLHSNGVPEARADKVAEKMVGDAVVGGVIGGAVASPIALAVGAVVGGGLGLIFGIPFLPTGLVVGPLVGTALVATLVALPAVAAGVVIGAAHGYEKGWTVPLDPPRSQSEPAPTARGGTNTARPAAQPASAPAVRTEASVPAPAVRPVSATTPADRRDPAAGCSLLRMTEVALRGGAIGSC